MSRVRSHLPRLVLLLGFTAATACGGGVLTSEDFSGPGAIAVGVVIVLALLYIAYVAGRGRD